MAEVAQRRKPQVRGAGQHTPLPGRTAHAGFVSRFPPPVAEKVEHLVRRRFVVRACAGSAEGQLGRTSSFAGADLGVRSLGVMEEVIPMRSRAILLVVGFIVLGPAVFAAMGPAAVVLSATRACRVHHHAARQPRAAKGTASGQGVIDPEAVNRQAACCHGADPETLEPEADGGTGTSSVRRRPVRLQWREGPQAGPARRAGVRSPVLRMHVLSPQRHWSWSQRQIDGEVSTAPRSNPIVRDRTEPGRSSDLRAVLRHSLATPLSQSSGGPWRTGRGLSAAAPDVGPVR
jgi:hypothetical protein